jgi:hypothetical protein
MPGDRIILNVYRDLYNRVIGEPDDGKLAQDAHEKRKRALEDDLNDPSFAVRDWGDTKDSGPHELVHVIVEVLANPATQAAAASAITFIGGVLSGVFSSLIVDGTKNLVRKLVGRMDRKEIQNFWITLPDGSTVGIQSDRAVNINITGGKNWRFEFDKPPITA